MAKLFFTGDCPPVQKFGLNLCRGVGEFVKILVKNAEWGTLRWQFCFGNGHITKKMPTFVPTFHTK